MNIGIDIDGVMTNLERFMLDYGIKICVDENWPIKIDISEYDDTKAFNWTKEQSDMFWEKYVVKYMTESEPREFAAEVIKKLQQEGNKIYFITARYEEQMPSEYFGKMQEITKKWLKQNKVKYEKLIFAKDKEKLQRCIENNVDVMIEDSPNNIEYMSKEMKVIKFDSQYNKHVNNENIITAYSWYHIYEIIKELNK